MTRTYKTASFLLLLTVVLLAAQSHAVTKGWTGFQNNNWDNNENWKNQSSYPDNTTVVARFKDDNYESSDRTIDLRGGTFDVLHLEMLSARDALRFYDGTIRLNGDILFNLPELGLSETAHVFDTDLEVVNNSTWYGGRQHSLTINGDLKGSGTIQLVFLDESDLGSLYLTLNGANSYSGNLVIDGGYVSLGPASALTFATVTLNWDDGLRLDGALAGNVGALAGNGNLNLDSKDFFVGFKNANTTYSGVITGTSDSEFRHVGTGTLTLSGGVSDLGHLRSSGGGLLLIDGTAFTLNGSNDFDSPVLWAIGADLTVMNGASVAIISSGTASAEVGGTLTFTGAGTSFSGTTLGATDVDSAVVVEQGATATVTVQAFAGANTDNTGNGSFTVQSGGTLLGGSALGLFGEDVGDTGTFTVTGSGSNATLNNLRLGGDTSAGGTGTAIVSSQGDVVVNNETKLWTAASSLTINGGSFSTGTLTYGAGATSTISISDPAGGTALTVGTNNGSSTLDGLIQNAAGGPGSLLKTGNGTLTLSAANTFTGETTINGGSIVLGLANALQNSTVSINVNDGLDVNGLGATLGGLSGTGDLNLGATALSVGNNNASTTYDGDLSGAGSLTKIGTGTLTLTGANTHTGGTTISAGRLKINVANAIPLASTLINNSELEFDILTGNNVYFNRYINGTGDVIKTGPGTLRLLAPNPFTGTTFINSGDLYVADNLALQNSTVQINLNNGLDVTNFNATLGGLSGTGNLDLGSKTLSVGNNNASTTYDGIVSGTGSLTKIGTGTLTLTASQNLAGVLNVTQGSVKIENDSTFGALTISDATLDGNQPDASNDINGADGRSISTTGVATVNATGLVSFNGGRGGNGTLFNNGKVGGKGGSFTANTAMVSGSAQIILSGGQGGTGDSFSNGGTGGAGGSFDITGGSTTLTESAQIILSGGNGGGGQDNGGNGGAGGSFELTGGSTTLSGSAQIVLSGGNGGGGQSNGGNGGAGGQMLISAGSLTVNVGASILLIGGEGGGGFTNGNRGTDGTVTVTDGNLTLSGGSLTTGSFDFSTGTGMVLVENAGSLSVSGETNLGNTMVVNGGTLSTDRLTGSAAALIFISDPVAGPALTVGTNGGSSTFDGIIADAASGPGSLTKVDNGTLTLTGDNTFSGATGIDAGSIILGNTNALQNSTVSINVNDGLDVNGLGATLGGLSGTGDLNLGATALSVGNNNASTTYSGVMSGGGSLTKIGTGMLTLTGANTYTGDTTIDAGTLNIEDGGVVSDGHGYIGNSPV